MTTYTTYDEAITREIIYPLTNGNIWSREEEIRAEYNIEAIAEKVIVESGTGVNYCFKANPDISTDEFWDITLKHLR